MVPYVNAVVVVTRMCVLLFVLYVCMLRECEGDGNVGVGDGRGVGVVSAEHVGGTHGSCIVSSAADLLGMSVVRGMKGVGGVCESVWLRAAWEEMGWIRGFGVFICPVETGGVFDLCLWVAVVWVVWGMWMVCGVGGVGGVSGERVVFTVFNPIAPYQYLLPTMYLFMADIANPDLFVCGCRTWICLDITRFYEEQS